MRTVLTIAGSDCSGGAGIQADLKTITAFGMYGMSVITALTVQNTQGVFAVSETGESVLKGQLDAVFSDITPDAVKIGMLPSEKAVLLAAEALKKYRHGQVVLDPVMVSTSGRRLMDKSAMEAAFEKLYPLVSVITPNVPEAEVIWGRHISAPEDMEQAALQISDRFHGAVLVKGGHMPGNASDCLAFLGTARWFPGKRLDVKNSHGTGCTLSSAIACGLAAGWDLETAVKKAKRYLTGALKNEPGLGHGNGPLNHCYRIPEPSLEEAEDE